MRRDARKNVRQNVRKNVNRDARKNVRKNAKRSGVTLGEKTVQTYLFFPIVCKAPLEESPKRRGSRLRSLSGWMSTHIAGVHEDI